MWYFIYENVLINTYKYFSFNHNLNFSSNKGLKIIRCFYDRLEELNCISKIENKMIQYRTNNIKNNSTHKLFDNLNGNKDGNSNK